VKLYSTDLNDRDLKELKNVLAAFYTGKATDKANTVWEEKGLTEANMEEWLNDKS
jgi:hypothetical protein